MEIRGVGAGNLTGKEITRTVDGSSRQGSGCAIAGLRRSPEGSSLANRADPASMTSGLGSRATEAQPR
jgi:hypothetical protein